MRYPWLKYMQEISNFSLIAPAAPHELVQTWVHGLYMDGLTGVSILLLLKSVCRVRG